MAEGELSALMNDAMASEAARAEPEPEPETLPGAEPEPVAPLVMPEPEPALVHVCTVLASTVGAIVTRRVRVEPLTEVEAEALGVAFAKLAAAYDFQIRDPRVAAWLGLGNVFAVVYLPRRGTARPDPEVEVVGKPSDPEASPADGYSSTDEAAVEAA